MSGDHGHDHAADPFDQLGEPRKITPEKEAGFQKESVEPTAEKLTSELQNGINETHYEIVMRVLHKALKPANDHGHDDHHDEKKDHHGEAHHGEKKAKSYNDRSNELKRKVLDRLDPAAY